LLLECSLEEIDNKCHNGTTHEQSDDEGTNDKELDAGIKRIDDVVEHMR
jgi:hypothetical protein